MREILFRGKRIDNGEWVHGYYFERKDTKGNIIESVIIVDAYEQITSGQRYMRSNLKQECFRVDAKTVGQFTGLKDKNGKKIFEWDIVKAERICNGNIWTGCVVWWNGCFAIQGLKDGNNVPAIDLFKNYEVIGNIHDNPELLEK